MSDIIPGLMILSEFVTDEDVFLAVVNSAKFRPIGGGNSRQIACFGYEYDMYKRRFIKIDQKIPSVLLNHPFIKSLHPDCNQLIINKYEAGQGIAAHIDAGGSKPVTCIVLESGCPIIFERAGERVEVFVEKNSIYQMSDECRTKWTHAINPVSTPRISLTFRTIEI